MTPSSKEPRGASASVRVVPVLTSSVAAAASRRLKSRTLHADPQEHGQYTSRVGTEEAMFVEPGRSSDKLRLRLTQLSKEAVGAKRFRLHLAKRARARRRQQSHTWRLRAARGEATVLESIAMAGATSADFLRRRRFFWDFVDFHKLPIKTDKNIDEALADWGDLEYLSGEGFEAGEKLLASLDRWALIARESRTLSVPRFKKVLRSWRKNAPRRSRLPMPEEFVWLLAGLL